MLAYDDGIVKLHTGDVLDTLREMPPQHVDCVVTSPPYWGLRDYGHAGQLGAEKTVGEYVQNMVSVFREVKRVLKDDGTLWLNLGDCYDNGNLVGVPWRVAFALQDDGWILRSDIVWHKPNPIPESVSNRPTRSHEYLFLLSKTLKYTYNPEGAKEPALTAKWPGVGPKHGTTDNHKSEYRDMDAQPLRNRRDVWTVPTAKNRGGHFAVFPDDLIRPCILIGAGGGGVVLDPFSGSGTVAAVAKRLGRRAIGIDINPDYNAIAVKRLEKDGGLWG